MSLHSRTRAMIRACLGVDASPPGQLRRTDPHVGDLVLFRGTGDGHAIDTGIVIGVRGPRVRFLYLHPLAPRACIGVLNLRQPHRRRLSGQAIENTFLRIKRRQDAPRSGYLAGQLLEGFASPP